MAPRIITKISQAIKNPLAQEINNGWGKIFQKHKTNRTVSPKAKTLDFNNDCFLYSNKKVNKISGRMEKKVGMLGLFIK